MRMFARMYSAACTCMLMCMAAWMCVFVCFSVCWETALLQPEPSQLTFRLAFLPLLLAALPARGLLAAQEKEEALHSPG